MAKRKRQITLEQAGLAKRQRLPPLPEQASFLGLPGELRNEIYAYIIDTELDGHGRYGYETAVIDEHWHKQPAICRVNKQLRNEILPLFYDCVEYFTVEIRDLKLGPKAGHFAIQQAGLVSLVGTHSWSNFTKWLKRHWSDKKTPTLADLGYLDEEYGADDVFEGAFRIVNTLADAKVKWEVVEGVLEGYKQATSQVFTDGPPFFWGR